jgi:hypothetical protein
MSANRGICFVIMPFSKTTPEHTEEYWARHYTSFLKPLIEENPNLEARRSEALRGDILRQIITDLVTSRVVVADLTDHNCNVYWELGIRQSFKHGTVTIAEEETKLPFDISTKGILTYHPENHVKMAEFGRVFKKAIQDCLENPDIPDSHVLETLGGRGTLFEIFRRDETVRRLDAVLYECNKNEQILKTVREIVEANQKDPKQGQVVTARLRVSAAELLATNRYVDEDIVFFDRIDAYLLWMDMVNSQLQLWDASAKSFEKWFLKTHTATVDCTRDFRTAVEQARDRVSKRF